ncbi:MAG: DUF3500 domain-containing protein [Pseudomonadota bacterium]
MTDHAHRSSLRATRRRVLATGAAAVAAAALPAPVRASAIGATMRERAARWLALLNPDQRRAARFDLASRRFRVWNYMLGSAFAPGVPLERMSGEQKDAALDLLASGLSREGLATALNIMLQQDILRDEWGKGSPERNRERFSLMLFGDPTASAPWGWRWEGHHLSLTYTLLGERVISVTPSAFASEPNTVPSGPHKGLVVLPEEEAVGRSVYTGLSEANRRAALLQRQSFGNILTTATRMDRVQAREGVPFADLPAETAERLVRLVEVYSVDHLPAPLADEQRTRLREGDLMGARFAWAGADLDGPSIYYRLHGDTFLIEFATVRNQPQHHHTIRHDLSRNLGAHLL